MIRAGVGFSNALNPKTAAGEATAAAMQEAGLAQAQAALCFATTAYGAAYPMILRAVGAEAKTPEVAGCSSLGVIAHEQEIESGNALAVIVLGGEEIGARRFFIPTLRGRGSEVATEIAAAVRPALPVCRHLQHGRGEAVARPFARASSRGGDGRWGKRGRLGR